MPRKQCRQDKTRPLRQELLTFEFFSYVQYRAGGLKNMADRYEEAAEIAMCEWCDDEGIRPTGHRCDHIDYAAIAKRGIAKVKAALKESQCSR